MRSVGIYLRDVDCRRPISIRVRRRPDRDRTGGSHSRNASSSSGRGWQTRSVLEQTPTNSDFVVIRSAGTNPSPPALNRGRQWAHDSGNISSRIATGLGTREASASPLPPVDLAKQEPPIMADATPTPAIKTVPKPRDQHLRDMADCIRFLSMDAVQQANSGHPGAPYGHGRHRDRSFQGLHAVRCGGSTLVRPRPVRAVERPRLDAALQPALSDRRTRI